MNKEEILKAKEILKQPIVVNCVDYKYFNQEQYDNLVRVYDNALWLLGIYEQLEQELTDYKEKVEMYENPEDLTLFYMWLDEKAKDKIKELADYKERNEKAIEYIKYCQTSDKDIFPVIEAKKMFEILDKKDKE